MKDQKIDGRIQGLMLPGFEKKVTWRETTNYSAAIGDENPCYLDDSRPSGIIAPPMFAVAFTWPVAGNFHEHLKEFLPQQTLEKAVHASEYLSFLRPIRPGDQLQVKSRIVAVKPTSAGTLVIIRNEILDELQKPVCIEEIGSLFRGVSCTLPAQDSNEYNVWHGEARIDAKAILWEEKINIPRYAPWVYDGCTGIVFPIHTSVAFAKKVGLPDIILQGTNTLALAAREITNREAGANPNTLKELACKFNGFIIPGSSINVQITKREKTISSQIIHFQVLNAQGDIALSSGYARIDITSPFTKKSAKLAT